MKSRIFLSNQTSSFRFIYRIRGLILSCEFAHQFSHSLKNLSCSSVTIARSRVAEVWYFCVDSAYPYGNQSVILDIFVRDQSVNSNSAIVVGHFAGIRSATRCVEALAQLVFKSNCR